MDAVTIGFHVNLLQTRITCAESSPEEPSWLFWLMEEGPPQLWLEPSDKQNGGFQKEDYLLFCWLGLFLAGRMDLPWSSCHFWFNTSKRSLWMMDYWLSRNSLVSSIRMGLLMYPILWTESLQVDTTPTPGRVSSSGTAPAVEILSVKY